MARAEVSTPKFGEAVKKFQSAGIHPRFFVPVAPPGATIGPNANLTENVLGKAPGRYNAKRQEWGGLFGAVVVKGLTRADFEAAADWPTGNVGVLGRAFPAIDSDAMSSEANKLVDKVVMDVFGDTFAERIRGDNFRRLYAFEAHDWENDPVRTRHTQFTLPTDKDPNKLDIIGIGGQYLIAGTHPSGDAYEWVPNAGLDDSATLNRLARITNADIENFFSALTEAVEAKGGTMGRVTGNGGGADERDVSELDPVMSKGDILDGLDRIPNNPDNFLHRDDFVSFLSAVRAAAGNKSSDPEFTDQVREWATAGGDDWCDDAYFDKIWNSLRRVRTGQDMLERHFRRNKVFHQSANHFDDKGPSLASNIGREKDKGAKDKLDLLDRLAGNYLFSDINLIEKRGNITMRSRWCPTSEWNAKDWYTEETTHTDKMLGDLYHEFGEGKNGFFKFIKAMKQRTENECWFDGEIVNPYEDFGAVIVENNADRGYIRRRLNRWHLPSTIRAAHRPDKNPARSADDVRAVLEFIETLFGKEMAQYELDTLAFMVQKNTRPGSMLFLVGEPGVGKSLYIAMNIRMFNGSLPEQAGTIDGNKMMAPESRRFALATVEGCRIISIKEMPDGRQTHSSSLKQITALFKIMVDPGPDGDYFPIERKGENTCMVENFARVMISSNYADAIEIEANDRRIFMVEAKILQASKPPEEWYARIGDIMQDPERLAAFYRYLMTRDISRYSRNRPPPSSSAKMQSIVARLRNPADRHMRAAIELLKHNERRVFDVRELCEIMSDMSEAESNYTGDGEPPIDYVKMWKDTTPQAKLKLATMFRPLAGLAIGISTARNQKARGSKFYVLPAHRSYAAELEAMDWRDREMSALDEIDRGCPEPHPWDAYRLTL